MSLYIFFQFIQLISIIGLKLLPDTNIVLLNFLTLTPILCSSIYVLYYFKEVEQSDKILFLSLVSAILGDVCLIYLNQSLGISFFFVAQCLYYSYLNKGKDIRILATFAFINFGLCLQFEEMMLKPEAAIYALITLFNVLKSISLIIKKKIKTEYFTSFFFLMICDLCLFLIFLFAEYNITFISSNVLFCIEWASYICFQILLSTAITKHDDYPFNEVLTKLISKVQVDEDPIIENCKKV